MSAEIGVRFSFSLERPCFIGIVIMEEGGGKVVSLPETWTPMKAGERITGELKLELTGLHEVN